MLKKKVISNSIGNLTDARYFAGWMVDYFIFSIDPKSEFYLSPQDIGTMQSWVEGPQFYLDYTEEIGNNPEKYLVDLNCTGIYIPYEERGQLSSYDVNVIYGLKEGDLEAYISYNKEEVGVLRTEKRIEDWEEWVKEKGALDLYYEIQNQEISEWGLLESSFGGFMVHGSAEEKVGYKSYDELDEIFELLQDF
jgi:phosphoribosylanthranilate isomerase